MIGGHTYEEIYFYLVITVAILSLIIFLSGGLLDIDGILSPGVVCTFFLSVGLLGFLGERFTSFHPLIVLGASAGISAIIVSLLQIFIFNPMKKADTSLSNSLVDLEGKTAKVTLTIPKGDVGEVLVNEVSGRVFRRAEHFSLPSADIEDIKQGEVVMIIAMVNGVAKVVPYDSPKEKL